MESIFDALEEEELLSDAEASENAGQKPSPAPKKRSSKDFSDDLQAFLQDAFDHSMEQQIQEREQKAAQHAPTSSPGVKKRSRRPMAGLDALIRSTVDPRQDAISPKRPERITISFDPEKLARLKSIARNQRTMLKDVIDQIVAEYLDKNYPGASQE